MAAVALLACGDDPTGVAGIAARLDIQPGQTQTLTAFGQTVQLVAVAHDAYNRVVSGVEVSWESRDGGIAGVDESGRVMALGDGATYIIARHTDLMDSVRVVVARPTEPFVIELVSGNGQSGDAWRPLAEPLVVRVRNAIGAPVAGHLVLWSVPVDDGLIDGRVMHACYGTVPLPVPTDAEGLAQVSFTPTTHGAMEVSAHLAANPELRVVFSSDAAATLSLTAVSGTHREATAGVGTGSLATGGMLKVLVTDAAGDPVTDVPVTWRVTAGQGRLAAMHQHCEYEHTSSTTMRTGGRDLWFEEPSGLYELRGLSVADFVPMSVGPSRIVATLGGPDAPPGAATLLFEIEVAAIRIVLVPDYLTGELQFEAPDPVSNRWVAPANVTVPVGTAVEWFNYLPTARIVSTTAPPAGATFDSGILGEQEQFVFVPEVAGVWTFIDQVSGASGTLTAE
jgi:hypothetical protein